MPATVELLSCVSEHARASAALALIGSVLGSGPRLAKASHLHVSSAFGAWRVPTVMMRGGRDPTGGRLAANEPLASAFWQVR